MNKELLYGTYLTFQVKTILEKSKQPLTISEIARALHEFENLNEARNLKARVNRSLKSLRFNFNVIRITSTVGEKKVLCYKYQINVLEKN